MRAVPQLSTRYRYPEPGSKTAWGGVGKPGSRRAAGSALGTTVTAFAPSLKIIIWFRDALRTRCTISQCPQLTRQKGEEKLPQKRKENPPMCVAITNAPSACHIYTNLRSAPHFCGSRLIIYLFDFWLAVLR